MELPEQAELEALLERQFGPRLKRLDRLLTVIVKALPVGLRIAAEVDAKAVYEAEFARAMARCRVREGAA